MKIMILALLLALSIRVSGQPTKTVHYTLDELCVDAQFMQDLDSIMHNNWDTSEKWEYATVWISEENEEYHVVATLIFPPYPPVPHKDHLGYIEYNGLIFIFNSKVNPDNMLVKKENGRKKTITTKIYEKGKFPMIEDPPEWWLIMNADKKLRDY